MERIRMYDLAWPDYDRRVRDGAMVLVPVGALVDPGSPVGLMGSSGRSTGPHLHFEIYRGSVPVDPLEVLDSHIAFAAGP